VGRSASGFLGPNCPPGHSGSDCPGSINVRIGKANIAATAATSAKGLVRQGSWLRENAEIEFATGPSVAAKCVRSPESSVDVVEETTIDWSCTDANGVSRDCEGNRERKQRATVHVRVFMVLQSPHILPSTYLFVARSRNCTSAARSCAEPMRCSGILVPGV
jgi:hypothetical protein